MICHLVFFNSGNIRMLYNLADEFVVGDFAWSGGGPSLAPMSILSSRRF